MQTEIDESISIKIVGISGKKFNGKDTLGVYFITKYGFKRIAFADALKDACKAIFNFSNEQLYGNEKEIIDPYWNVTPRKVLEYLGTDLCRNQLGNILPDVGSDLWVKVAKKKIEDTLKQNPNAKFVFTIATKVIDMYQKMVFQHTILIVLSKIMEQLKICTRQFAK
jgi:hypothetical protein